MLLSKRMQRLTHDFTPTPKTKAQKPDPCISGFIRATDSFSDWHYTKKHRETFKAAASGLGVITQRSFLRSWQLWFGVSRNSGIKRMTIWVLFFSQHCFCTLSPGQLAVFLLIQILIINPRLAFLPALKLCKIIYPADFLSLQTLKKSVGVLRVRTH